MTCRSSGILQKQLHSLAGYRKKREKQEKMEIGGEIVKNGATNVFDWS
jgi:hypothetical protein